MKNVMIILLRLPASLFVLLALVICVFSVSPIYDFSAPEPFCGPDIYNPYAGLPDRPKWKRANFHAHTRVDNLLNECPEYPAVVYDDYMKLGYDILAFSNHNLLTRHPYDSTLQINVYEHGYSLFKFHKLVFNPSRMMLYDHLLPLFVSQKQWQYDYLSRNADFLVMNHPDRTMLTTPRSMRLLTGYRFMEADSGISTELLHWDEALSAGHYSHCLINDDCHDSGDHRKIGRRCSWLATHSARYEDVKATLLAGAFYSMRVPDFGDGDWRIKYAANDSLPRVEAIGLQGDTVFLRLSAPARIEAWGQGHELLETVEGTCFERPLAAGEPYMRLTACFDDGVVLYTNAFARYDSGRADSPYEETPHRVNWLLTVLFNAGLLALAVLLCLCFRRLWAPHKELEA